MLCRRPLPTIHPELESIQCEGYTEYRVYNQRLARDGSGRIIFSFSGWTWLDGLVPIVVACIWRIVHASQVRIVGLLLVLVFYGYSRLSQVLWESVVILPPHGLQLETHHGFPSLPLFTKRRFIPIHALEDFIIHEGLQGWNVRYYLAAVMQSSSESYCLAVAFEHTLPHFLVLQHIYRAVQTKLLHPDEDEI